MTKASKSFFRLRKLNWRETVGLCMLAASVYACFFPIREDGIHANGWIRLERVKQAALAAILFANDHNDTLPDMINADVFQLIMLPYAKESKLLPDPVSKKPFLPNVALSHVQMDGIDHPEKVVLQYAPDIDSRGSRAVAFLDGHAKNVPENEFVQDLALTGTQKPALGPLLGKWGCVEGTITLEDPDVATLADHQGRKFKGVATFNAEDRLTILFKDKAQNCDGTVEWKSLDDFILAKKNGDYSSVASFGRVK